MAVLAKSACVCEMDLLLLFPCSSPDLAQGGPCAERRRGAARHTYVKPLSSEEARPLLATGARMRGAAASAVWCPMCVCW